MDDKKLLKNIGDLMDTKLQPIKQQLNTLELKVELVNKRVEQAQEETIEALSELVTSGHTTHEKRIKRIEDHLQLPQIQ